jgi:DNA-directed RNA polymerase I subunit RPA1
MLFFLTFKVEAGRNTILKEIRGVFGVYGIAVDYRHLSLIADFMTYSGGYRPFNRVGMEDSGSPFLKMSFETTMSYMSACCSILDKDDTSAPSSSIILGLVPKVGTGIMQVMHSDQSISKSK